MEVLVTINICNNNSHVVTVSKLVSSTVIINISYRLTLINRNILPILKTRTTLKSVGDTGKSIITSSISIPRTDAKTSKKSKTFQGTVK